MTTSYVSPPVDRQGVTEADLATVDAATHRRIEDFLYLEAELLDDRRFNDWVTLFAEDLHYVVPLRVTREAQAEWDIAPTGRVFDDTRETMAIRIERLNTEYAWAEQPPSRTRHYVTNVRAKPAENDGEYRVRSNVLIYRSRGDHTRYDIFSVARNDLLRDRGDRFELVRRHAVLDQSAVNAHNLSIFL
jgi:3-phenylpropionate/cinnamic acid dioxygenase small subunit